MYDYSKLDVNEDSFILPQDDAVRYLKWKLNDTFDIAMSEPSTYGMDSEYFAEQAKDLMEMAYTIADDGWSWVKFESHPMSASGIHIKEIKEN